jgi:hypothetical protein
METIQATPVQTRPGGRAIFLVGLSWAVLGVGAYLAALMAGRFPTPWFAPALAMVGVLFVLWSLRMRRTVVRFLALFFLALLVGVEVWFLLGYTPLPAYAGPLKSEEPFPEFHAALADGTPITRAKFEGPKDTALIFYRGHW